MLRPFERPGRADARPFRPGKANAPSDRARRASAVLAASLAPASFVVDVPLGRGEVLMHGIERRPPVRDADWLA